MGKRGVRAIAITALLLCAATAESAAAANTTGAANGRIIFTDDRAGGDFDVFVMNPDGSGVLNLTATSAATDQDPVFSPDGTRIAYASNIDGDQDVYIANSDGTNPVNVTPSLTDPQSEPSFSPNGQSLSYTHGEPGVTSAIRIIELENYVPVSGFTATGFAPGTAGSTWTPDGNLVFQSRATGQTDILIRRADGTVTNLTAGYAETAREPSVSPDGQSIAFVSFGGSDSGFALDIFVMGIDGGGIRNLTPGNASDETTPAFSPDGNLVAYEQSDFGDQDIKLVNLNGVVQSTLTANTEESGFDLDWEYVFSCNGVRATAVGSAEADRFEGTPGPDVIAGHAGDDFLIGGAGDDVFCGAAGNDRVLGGTGKDLAFGDEDRDNLDGGAGKDRLIGAAGRDRLSGGRDKDRLSGGAGRDKLVGGKGKDKINGGPGKDVIKDEKKSKKSKK